MVDGDGARSADVEGRLRNGVSRMTSHASGQFQFEQDALHGANRHSGLAREVVGRNGRWTEQSHHNTDVVHARVDG
jgi:hypothetical protein